MRLSCPHITIITSHAGAIFDDIMDDLESSVDKHILPADSDVPSCGMAIQFAPDIGNWNELRTEQHWLH